MTVAVAPYADADVVSISKAARLVPMDRGLLSRMLRVDAHFREAVAVELPGFPLRVSVPLLLERLHKNQCETVYARIHRQRRTAQ